MDLREPTTNPFVRRTHWWRRLPLTAQLAAAAMLVLLGWFLAAQLVAARAQEVIRERSARLEALHNAELAASRLATSVGTMAAAQRGFIIYADETNGIIYERARRAFTLDAATLRELTAVDARIARELDRQLELLGTWDRAVVTPNFAARRLLGFAGFAENTPGAQRLSRGVAMLDTMRISQAQVARDLREARIRFDAEIETAAARGEWENFLLSTAAFIFFILVIVLMMRFVSRSLNKVVTAAEALDAGRYTEARFPDAHHAPNREMARLASTFDRLSQSIATRERQLQEDIEKLKELERLKADFVSTVSHELRTPLTSMRGALGLVLGGKAGALEPKARDLLRIALTNTDRLVRLINDILDIEKMDAGHIAIRRDRLRLRALLESTLAGLDGLARDANVRLELAEVAEVELIGDSDRLIQVFTNLISNAVKFSPKGQAVEVSARVESDQVKVCVRDHGPGIPEEFASRIFGRFQQAGGAESRQSGGTGLGLSIAKAITELHGGRIGFESAEGGGTTFGIMMPVAPRPTGEQDTRPGVLIVEDDDSMRDVLSALLEPFARPIAVGDAGDAMRALGRQRVQVVILDHGLPGMDGLAFARRLRQDPRHRTLPILLYSASEFGPDDLKESGIRISDAFVKTRDSETSLIDRVRRELQGAG